MEFLLDIMDEEDLDQIMEIEKDVFNSPWSRTAFLSEINKNPYANYYTARNGRNIVGYIGGWVTKGRLHITNLAVHKSYRRFGAATLLTEELVKTSRIQGVDWTTLEVRASNKEALSFYKKIGFTVIDQKKNYYKDNDEDALIMWKVIDCE